MLVELADRARRRRWGARNGHLAERPAAITRAGWYSNQAWLAAALRVCAGTVAAEVLLALPPLPRELVVVPHADEGPARAGVLEVRVREIAAVERAVVVDRRRHVEVA